MEIYLYPTNLMLKDSGKDSIMLKILLVSPDKGSLSGLASAWTESGDVD